ncbi:MAG: hypothetical protein GY860_10525, partial [Desulfobacteraceae bacterium]|nr:hypothetical protein [Desulfobacteraceae bacterium]
MKFVGLMLLGGIIFLGGLTLFSRKLLYFTTQVSKSRLAYLKTNFDQVKEITIPIEGKGYLH